MSVSGPESKSLVPLSTAAFSGQTGSGRVEPSASTGNMSLVNTEVSADGSLKDPSDEQASPPERPAPEQAPLVDIASVTGATPLGKSPECPFLSQEGDFSYFEFHTGSHNFTFKLDTSKVPLAVSGWTQKVLPRGSEGSGWAISLVSSGHQFEIVQIRLDKNYRGRDRRYNVVVTDDAYKNWVSWEEILE